MKVSININDFPLEEQYRIYDYLKNKFEINRSEKECVNTSTSIKEVEVFTERMKFTLLRNGIRDIPTLLKLNKQDLINMAGIGRKSRTIIERFCENYRSKRV